MDIKPGLDIPAKARYINLLLIDGIAIILIVIDHQLRGFGSNATELFYTNFLAQYTAIFGLILFTFSSGSKLMFNHLDDLKKYDFIINYFKKRSRRLLKPYIVCSFMIFIIPIVILSSILSNNLKNSVFLNNFLANIYNGGIIIGFLTGDSKYIGHLWYLYALFIIFAFTFLILYVTKNKNILYLSIIPIIFLDITLNINGESIISRILLYLPIFLIALLYTDIRLNNKQLSSIICNVLSIVFIMVFLINVFYPNILILNSILIFGFTLPFFILNVTNYLVRTRFINKSLITCGKHSFVIYLFHEPYILTILDMVVIGLLKINNVAMPFLITAITIIICIYISKTLKTYNLYKLVE